MIKIFKKTMQSLVNLLGYEIVSLGIDSEVIEDAYEVIEKCKNYTMTSKERMYTLSKAVEYIVNAKIPGDFVECGVWRGGSAMVIAYVLLSMKETDRKIWLYDTYEGMPKPTEEDKTILDGESAINEWKKQKKGERNNWCFASLPEVRENMLSTGYPAKNLIFIKGKVEKTIPKTIPSKIALLRLDTDWYKSTKHELIHLYPIIIKNGVLMVDDYGHWSGSKKAVDEYFKERTILFNRVDRTGVIGIKTE